jgi:PAS domain-containing protein
MDLPDLTRAGWPALFRIGEAPEALTAALVSAVATLGLVLFFAPRLPIARGGRTHATPREPAACDFLINGASVKPLTEPARTLLDSLDAGGPRLAALTVHLAADCPDLQPDLEALVLYGTGFRHHCPRGDGTALEIVGEPRGAAAFLSVRPASEEARALRETEAELVRAGSEVRFLRDLLDRAPVLAWSNGPDGQVAWANAPYRDRFDPPGGELPDHRIADAFGHVLEEVPLTARGGGTRRRVAVPARDGSEPQWFDLSETTGAAGESFGFALAADDLVAAEASLRRFVETLTETFAHLPIGLAVFDKNRRLGLFNPALTDLVKIDAVWLAGRPSLRDFLERLRETRQMPEQKDFASWRRKLSELEEGARSGTYEENWQLPSGKILRVTGRPHPQGALAFLFEDISTAIMLERKYRSELELSQATLDRVSEAVAVFDASGMLVFVNSAFEALWGLDPMARLDGPGVAAMAALWAERCAPSTAWARLTEFTTAADARTSWTERIMTRDGRAAEMLVAPLPDASALVVFRDRGAVGGEAEAEALAARLAAEALRGPVEALLPRLAAALPAAPSPEAFQALGGGLQALRQGLARAEALSALAHAEESGPAATLAPLAAALAARGHALEVEAEVAGWDAPVRRAAIALGLAAAEAATPTARIALACGDDRGGRALTVRTATAGKSGETVGLALARRIVEAAGGSLRVEEAGGVLTLAADLPEPAAYAPAACRA